MKAIINTLAIVVLSILMFGNTSSASNPFTGEISVKITKSTESEGVYTLTVLGLKAETPVNVVLQSKAGDIIFDSNIVLFDESDEIDVLTSGCKPGSYIITVKGEDFEKTGEFSVDSQL